MERRLLSDEGAIGSDDEVVGNLKAASPPSDDRVEPYKNP
jgi:hypothetical protein